MLSIPDRLRSNGRQPDPIFEDNECLYFRCSVDQIDENGILQDAIKFPNWSTNRAKYSEPEDVLLPKFSNWGIAQFRIIDIPKSLQSEGGITCQFRPIHDPVSLSVEDGDTYENYAHTEVRTFKDNVFDIKRKPPTLIKKEFRARLAARIKIIKRPSALSA